MPVSLNLAAALVAGRIVASEEAIPEPTSKAAAVLWALAVKEVEAAAPSAPPAVQDAAAVRMLSYLWSADPITPYRGYQSALRNSGAHASLAPYRARRAVVVEVERSGRGTGPAIDQTARDAAAAAQRTADQAETAAAASAGFLSTFASRVRALVESLVPSWAREPNPPSGGGGSLADGAVTTNKLADDAVTSRKIAAQAITSGLIADDAVESAKIPSDAILSRHIGADQITGSEVAGDTIEEANLTSDVRTKLNSRGGTGGDDAYGWATEGNTEVIPVAKVPRVLSIAAGADAAAIAAAVAGEKDGDLAFGYTASTVTAYRFSTSANAWQSVASWARTQAAPGRTDAELETFIESIVSAWAIQGSADGIPGAKTFDGLFRSEAQTGIAAANVTVLVDVGNAGDGDEVDETDAAGTSFNVTSSQANERGAFIRCRWALVRTRLDGDAPKDIELLLQTSAGVKIGSHNIKDEGTGTAQFPVGDAGAKRWAVRIVTNGRYAGSVAITETEYHSAQPLADPAIEHVVHPIVSDEAEERQAQDAAIRAEVKRVEGLAAIVNGLPAATATRKSSAIDWESGRQPYQQKAADAFQVPATGFVQFILGNLGATPIMRAEDCANRQMGGIYTFGTHSIGLTFDSSRRAILLARDGAQRSSLSGDIVTTTVGYVMLHWDVARADTSGPPDRSPELVQIGTADRTGSGNDNVTLSAAIVANAWYYVEVRGFGMFVRAAASGSSDWTLPEKLGSLVAGKRISYTVGSASAVFRSDKSSGTFSSLTLHGVTW